jgi:hypothetical protein
MTKRVPSSRLAHFGETVDMQIYRPRTDSTATGQRHQRLAITGQQRPEDQDRRTHGLHELVGCVELANAARIHFDVHGLVHDQVDTHAAQQLHGRGDVVQVRNVADCHGTVAEQGGGENWQRGVLCPGNPDLAVQRRATSDD